MTITARRLGICAAMSLVLWAARPASAASVAWQGTTGANWGDAAQWSPAQVPNDIAVVTIKTNQPDLMGNAYTINYLDMAGDNNNRVDGNGIRTVGGTLTLNGDASGVGLRTFTGGRTHYLYPNINLGMANRGVTNVWHLRRPGEGGGTGYLYLYGVLGGTGSLRLYSDPPSNTRTQFFYANSGNGTFDGETHVLFSSMFYYPSNITANATYRFGTKSGGEALITLDKSLFEFAPVSHTAVAPDVVLANDFAIGNTGFTLIYRKRGRSTASMAYPNVIYSGKLTLAGPLMLAGESGSSPVANANSGVFVPWAGGLIVDQSVAGWAQIRQNRDPTVPVFPFKISDGDGTFRNPFLPGMDSNGLLTFSATNSTYRYGTVVGWCGNAYDSGTWVSLSYGNSQNAGVMASAAGGLGTGDVIVSPGGRLYLNGYGVLAATQTVTVQGHALALGSVTLKDDGVTALPGIATASTGVISLSGNSAAPFNALMAAGPGNKMFLGAGMQASGTFTGTSLAPGSDGVYRLGGANRAQALTLDAPGVTGVLTGARDVQVNALTYNGSGLVYLSDTNSFTGTLRVYGSLLDYRSSALRGTAAVGGSPFGAADGVVGLYGAGLIQNGNGAITKGATSFAGESSLELTGGSTAQTLTVASLTRSDRAILRARDSAGTHTLGATYRIIVASPGADLTPGSVNMVAPYYLNDIGGAIHFATHTPANGFARVTYATSPLATAAATDIVTQNVAVALSANAQCHALRVTGAVTASGADRTVTLGSGGLLLGANLGAATGYNVNVDFGGQEGVIYGTGADVYLYGKLSNTGGNGLTLGGDIIRLVNTNNDFVGTVAVSSGSLIATLDRDDGTGRGALGPTSNGIRLDGGYLGHLNTNGWRTIDAARTLTLGPLGGGLRDDDSGGTTYLKCRITGPGALYLAGWETYVIDNPANDWSGGTLINSYNDGVIAGCSANGKMGQGPVVLMSTYYSAGCSFRFNGNDNLHYTAGPEKYLPVQVCGAARAYFRSAAPVMGTLTGDGEVILGSTTNDAVLTVGLDGGDGTFYGAVGQIKSTVGQGVGSLAKDGAGTFTLYGPHTYTGTTTVRGGTLTLMGSVASNVIVNAGATLSGIGRIGGALTLNGTCAAQLASDFAPLRVGGAVTINSGASVDVSSAAGFSPGSQEFTVLQAGGAITGLSNLTVTPGYAARVIGQNLVLFRSASNTVILVR